MAAGEVIEAILWLRAAVVSAWAMAGRAAATLLARQARLDDAARIAAYAERVFAERGRRPRPVGRLLRERLLAQLTAELPAHRPASLHTCLSAFRPAR